MHTHTGSSKKDVRCEFRSTTIKFRFDGNPGGDILNGQLARPVDPDGCAWQIDGPNVVLTLEKADHPDAPP